MTHCYDVHLGPTDLYFGLSIAEKARFCVCLRLVHGYQMAIEIYLCFSEGVLCFLSLCRYGFSII